MIFVGIFIIVQLSALRALVRRGKGPHTIEQNHQPYTSADGEDQRERRHELFDGSQRKTGPPDSQFLIPLIFSNQPMADRMGAAFFSGENI